MTTASFFLLNTKTDKAPHSLIKDRLSTPSGQRGPATLIASQGLRTSLVTSQSQIRSNPSEAIAMSWRLRSVRRRILLLALVPVLSLIGIYTFYTSIAARDAINLARAGTLKVQTTVPAGNILVALNTERPAAMVYLAAPAPTTMAGLNGAVQKTNRAVAAARAALMSDQTTNNASPGEQHAINVLLAAVKTLPTLHAQIASRAISRPAAMAAYDHIVADDYQGIIWSIRQETN